MATAASGRCGLGRGSDHIGAFDWRFRSPACWSGSRRSQSTAGSFPIPPFTTQVLRAALSRRERRSLACTSQSMKRRAGSRVGFIWHPQGRGHGDTWVESLMRKGACRPNDNFGSRSRGPSIRRPANALPPCSTNLVSVSLRKLTVFICIREVDSCLEFSLTLVLQSRHSSETAHAGIRTRAPLCARCCRAPQSTSFTLRRPRSRSLVADLSSKHRCDGATATSRACCPKRGRGGASSGSSRARSHRRRERRYGSRWILRKCLPA